MSFALLLAMVQAQSSPVVRVDASGSCPSRAAVSEALARAGATVATAAEGARHMAVVSRDGRGALLIKMRGADGADVGERKIDGAFPCPDLADAPALTIVAWALELDPGTRATPAVPASPVQHQVTAAAAEPKAETLPHANRERHAGW